MPKPKSAHTPETSALLKERREKREASLAAYYEACDRRDAERAERERSPRMIAIRRKQEESRKRMLARLEAERRAEQEARAERKARILRNHIAAGVAFPIVKNDGGRAAAGYKGVAGDCVVRSVAIALGLDYQFVYDQLWAVAKEMREDPRTSARDRFQLDHDANRKRLSPRTGVRPCVYQRFLLAYGYRFEVLKNHSRAATTMRLTPGVLPESDHPILVSVNRHLTCLVDGVMHDTWHCSPDGRKPIYSYAVRS